MVNTSGCNSVVRCTRKILWLGPFCDSEYRTTAWYDGSRWLENLLSCEYHALRSQSKENLNRACYRRRAKVPLLVLRGLFHILSLWLIARFGVTFRWRLEHTNSSVSIELRPSAYTCLQILHMGCCCISALFIRSAYLYEEVWFDLDGWRKHKEHEWRKNAEIFHGDIISGCRS